MGSSVSYGKRYTDTAMIARPGGRPLSPHRLAAANGQVVRRRVPLTQWQVDLIGPLPASDNAGFALTAVDPATSFSFA